MASGFLKDLIEAGHLSQEMSYLALNPCKLRRARQGVMASAQKQDTVRATEETIRAISFDGRKDNTRVLLPSSDGSLHPQMIKEEHISVTWWQVPWTLHT